jgi:hypothetical protein
MVIANRMFCFVWLVTSVLGRACKKPLPTGIITDVLVSDIFVLFCLLRYPRKDERGTDLLEGHRM